MSDLETKLAEARERLLWTYYTEAAQIIALDAMNVASAIAREVVADKDADLRRLDDEICDLDDKIAEKDALIVRLKRELDRRPFLEPDEHIGKDSDVIAREAEIARLGAVIAEKDAEIARLEAILSGFGYQHKLDVSTGERVWFKCVVAEPPKVTDAQREQILDVIADGKADDVPIKQMVKHVVAIIESTDEPATK
jgi:predicted RNase H-like nuclease (RuvC/YqgF family)